MRRDSGTVAEGGTYKMAAAYKSGDSMSVFDGVLMTDNVANTAFAPLTAFDRLLPGATGAQARGGIWITRVGYWPHRLLDGIL